MKLIIQPDEGLTPLLQAVKRARRSIDIVIFRFDRPELEKALAAAVARGVTVRSLIAHTNRGGEKKLRKLELRLLGAGGHDRLVVSPESARKLLAQFLSGAKRELLIYDPRVSDRMMLRTLAERCKAGVEIRIIGTLEKGLPAVKTRTLAGMRLHVRAIIRDGSRFFVGSQSLRKLELDGRREVGVIVSHGAAARKLRAVFESDWAASAPPAAKERDTGDAAEPILASAAR